MPDQARSHTSEDSSVYPADLLAQRLNMISDFVDQACADFERHPAQSRRMLLVFTAVLGGLTQDLQAILTPELRELARGAVDAAAGAEGTQLSEGDRESSARLLAGIWGTGATEGVTAENWRILAPGLASACLQVARLTGQYERWNPTAPEPR
ncbi:hypothetical protein ACFPFX_37800 [Streptomyces mauvecolor]|uniref:TetR family transcriptional regulator n=1 Tax=Streptomyces mauvecolor TaxID=58345 RepID=A0ABV9UXV0_9ACTN